MQLNYLQADFASFQEELPLQSGALIVAQTDELVRLKAGRDVSVSVKRFGVDSSAVTDRAAQRLLRRGAPEAAGLQRAGVVGHVHQQVEGGGAGERLLPPRTQLVTAAPHVRGRLELTLTAGKNNHSSERRRTKDAATFR